MTKPFIFAFGRVKSSTVITPQKGKPFLCVKCEMVPDHYGGRTYTHRFEARVRWNYEDLDIKAGDWISVHGEARTEGYLYGEQKVGALQIIDCANIFPAPIGSSSRGAEVTPAPEEPKPAPSPPSPRSIVSSGAKPAAEPAAQLELFPEVEDDVSF